jgi:hypothetical protein
MMQELASRIEHRLRFSSAELLRMLATVLVAAFILSFRKWGGETFDLVTGIINLILSAALVFIFLLVHFAVQKIVALNYGYSSEYKNWHNGFLISLIMAFFSFGFIPLFFTGVLSFEAIPKLRIGTFRGGIMHKHLGIIAVAGPVVNVIIVGLLAPIYIATKNSFVFDMITINLLIALFSMLPIPTFEKFRQFKGGTTGLYLFIASRWAYFLAAGAFLGFALLIWVAKIFSFVIAIILGALTAFIYFRIYESEK